MNRSANFCRVLLGALVALPLVLLSSGAPAATIEAPTFGESGGVNTPVRTLPRQYMEYIDETQIFIPGADAVLITGARLRMSAGAQAVGIAAPPTPWPPAPISFASYEMQLSRPGELVTGAVGGAQFPDFTHIWADYQEAGSAVTVMSGQLDIPAGSYPFTSADFVNVGPNAFGFEFVFDVPYQYTPGEALVIYIKHSGFGGQVGPFFASADFVAEGADALSATSDVAPTPGAFSFPVLWQFTFAPVPEPSGYVMLGLGMAIALAFYRGPRAT